MDSVIGLKPMTFDEVSAKMTQINAAFKQHPGSETAGKTELSTNGALIDTGSDGFSAMADTIFVVYPGTPSLTICFSYPSLYAVQFPWYFALTLTSVGGPVRSSAFGQPYNGSNGDGWSYVQEDAGGGDSNSFEYLVDGYSTFLVSVANGNGGYSYYSVHYYVQNNINGSYNDSNYYVTSGVFLTKA